MRLYDTLTGRKEELAPSTEVRMYVCGVTPYDSCHLGHALSYILFDVLRRYLEFRGHPVRHVQNFTDIDDKIIARAARLGEAPLGLAERFMAEYFRDMDALHIQRAHVYPRATQEIPKIIEVVAGLVAKGHAYRTPSGVYFRVTSFPGYGKLSHRTLKGMLAGARVEVDPEKEHPADFALWKTAQPGEPSWESPWGPGRPGWHIECSAMSLRYLGETLDIHGGGQDLIFPHHENEIAQSEAFTGRGPFARFWVHNGLLQMGQEKMSKSLGNLITVKDFLSRHSADALRLLVFSSHYRVNLVFTDETVAAAESGVETLHQAFRRAGPGGAEPWDTADYRRRFIEAMDDDLNTPQAVAVLFDLARETETRRKNFSTAQAEGLLRELAGVLGLALEERLDVEAVSQVEAEVRAWVQAEAPALAEQVLAVGNTASKDAVGFAAAQPTLQAYAADVDRRVFTLMEIRRRLRASKHWALADRLRTRLREVGVALEDTPQGTAWRYLPEAQRRS